MGKGYRTISRYSLTLFIYFGVVFFPSNGYADFDNPCPPGSISSDTANGHTCTYTVTPKRYVWPNTINPSGSTTPSNIKASDYIDIRRAISEAAAPLACSVAAAIDFGTCTNIAAGGPILATEINDCRSAIQQLYVAKGYPAIPGNSVWGTPAVRGDRILPANTQHMRDALDSLRITCTSILPPSCTDLIQNQGEAGIDCGGPCPTACPVVACYKQDIGFGVSPTCDAAATYFATAAECHPRPGPGCESLNSPCLAVNVGSPLAVNCPASPACPAYDWVQVGVSPGSTSRNNSALCTGGMNGTGDASVGATPCSSTQNANTLVSCCELGWGCLSLRCMDSCVPPPPPTCTLGNGTAVPNIYGAFLDGAANGTCWSSWSNNVNGNDCRETHPDCFPADICTVGDIVQLGSGGVLSDCQVDVANINAPCGALTTGQQIVLPNPNMSSSLRECTTGITSSGTCQYFGRQCSGAAPPPPPTATCFDGLQNQGETGVDCGGPCAACTPTTVWVFINQALIPGLCTPGTCPVSNPAGLTCLPAGNTCWAPVPSAWGCWHDTYSCQ